MGNKIKYLNDYFAGILAKRMSAVEANRCSSNQHELNGISTMKMLLGTEKRAFSARAFYLSDEEQVVDWEGTVTWYDAREQTEGRTEHRMYIPDSPVYESVSEGDLLILAKTTEDSLVLIFARAGSTGESQMSWLFGVDEGNKMACRLIEKSENTKVGYAARRVLELLGIVELEIKGDYLDIMLEKFDGKFPSTRVFSLFARETSPTTNTTGDPDATLLSWMDHEEMLFRTLERYIVTKRIETGFGSDVDSFMEFSLSVHNRRKSRAGRALENHAENIFQINEIRFSRGARTENKSSPDFLFPGIDCYLNTSFDDRLLTMLGAKSSCKDRWRQVISEANRINEKHLLTLEPGISEAQTKEMISKRLRLVVPKELHKTFTANQQKWLMNLAEFIDFVKDRQRQAF